MKRNLFGIDKKILFILCPLYALGLLCVGLWPFNFWPENKVAWLKDRNGVHFYGQGIIFSEPVVNSSKPPFFYGGPVTLEICLQPDREPDSSLPHIFSLYDGKESEIFFLAQWKSGLVLQTRILQPHGRRSYKAGGIKDALRKGQGRVITITADQQGTNVYLDGKLEEAFPPYSFIPKNGTTPNQIILGNSPIGKDSWAGNIYGLAVYNRSLTADQVFHHFQNWANGKIASSPEKGSQVAIYLFNERAGTRIHDQINHLDLLMPPRFIVPQKNILVPPWEDFRLTFSFFQDVMINILGFIPLGFLITALTRKRITSCPHSVITVILLGSFLSLTIELIQVYLPNRYSQLMDVFTNTLGTVLGIILFHFYQSRGKS